MSRISNKISGIRFQTIKNLSYSLTDEQLISAVQSIYDKLIDIDTDIPADTIMPEQALGVNLVWNGRTIATMSKGTLSLEDDFTDDIKPSFDTPVEEIPENTFMTNGKAFQTNANYFVTNLLLR